MADNESRFEGPFDVPPDSVIPVGTFGFGFGNIAGFDEEGVASHPVALLMTNDGNGPTLMFDALSVQPLVTGLMGAGLKSMTTHNPKLKEYIGDDGDNMFAMLDEMQKTPSERERAKEDKLTARWERIQLAYGLVIVVLGIVMSLFWGWTWFLTTVVIYFTVQGLTTNLVRGWFTFRRWRRERKHTRAVKRATADVDGLRPPD